MSEGPSSGEQAHVEPQRLFLAQLLGPPSSGAEDCPGRQSCAESLESPRALAPPLAELEKQSPAGRDYEVAVHSPQTARVLTGRAASAAPTGRGRPRWWQLTEEDESGEDDAPCQARRCLELQAEAQRRHTLLESSSSEHTRLQAEAQRLHTLLESSASEHARLQAEIEQMKGLLKESGNHHARLQAEVEHLQTELTSSSKQQEELKAVNISLTAALQGAQDEKTLAQSEAAGLRLQLSERANQLTHLQETTTTLSAALEAAHDGETKATDEVLVLRRERDSIQLQLQQQFQQQQQQQKQQKRERLPKQPQRCADESAGQGNCTPTALTSLTAELHKTQMALVSIVPELERRLEEKDAALVQAEERIQRLLCQIDGRCRGDFVERRNNAGIQEERDGVHLKIEPRMHTMQATGPGKAMRTSVAQNKSEARSAMDRHSVADGVGRTVPPAG